MLGKRSYPFAEMLQQSTGVKSSPVKSPRITSRSPMETSTSDYASAASSECGDSQLLDKSALMVKRASVDSGISSATECGGAMSVTSPAASVAAMSQRPSRYVKRDEHSR